MAKLLTFYILIRDQTKAHVCHSATRTLKTLPAATVKTYRNKQSRDIAIRFNCGAAAD